MLVDDPLHPRLLLETASASIEINSTAAAALLQLPRLVPQLPVVQDSAVVRVLRRNHPGLPFLVLTPRESDGRYDPPSDPAWWRAQLAELAPVLNASAAEEKTSVLDAAYWRRFLGELKALV